MLRWSFYILFCIYDNDFCCDVCMYVLTMPIATCMYVCVCLYSYVCTHTAHNCFDQVYNYAKGLSIHTHFYQLQLFLCQLSTYRIAGILCEVLICANYESSRGITDFNPIYIGLLHTFSFQFSDWSALAIVPCLWLHNYTKWHTKHPCRHDILSL